MSATDWPAGATEVSDWADIGTPDEFRTFDGPKWTLPGIRWGFGDTEEDGYVAIYGTQLRDGTVEERCIRVGGLHWDDELDSQTARDIAGKLLEAADALDRLTD
ncbi:hypothetical protein [Mycolicibacterium elephantis]